jgi:hypothetical protein
MRGALLLTMLLAGCGSGGGGSDGADGAGGGGRGGNPAQPGTGLACLREHALTGKAAYFGARAEVVSAFAAAASECGASLAQVKARAAEINEN